MEQIENRKSVDSQQIWLKSVRYEPDWLHLTNPMTEGGDLDRSRVDIRHPLWGIVPSLSPPHVWDILEALWINVSVCGLIGQLNQPPNWQLGSVEAQFNFRLGIDGLSFSCSGLSPWDLRPPWDGSPIFCINKFPTASSKLVRVGLRTCFHSNTTLFLLWMKNLRMLYHVVHVFVWIPSVMLLMR